MVRNYENMVVLKANITDEEKKEVFDKITKKIESLEGKVLAAKIWAKERNLCFPLKSSGAEKALHHKGCYWLVVFTVDTSKLAELKETMRLDERILRSMTINCENRLPTGLLENNTVAAA